jgi:hypothetical protein
VTVPPADGDGSAPFDPENPPVEPWYAVRCVIRGAISGPTTTYEERITLWRAPSADEAIELAEAEAIEYGEALGDAEYTGFAQSFNLFVGDTVGHGDEVFSLMRDSELDTEDYLDAFFDTGTEHQGVLDGTD